MIGTIGKRQSRKSVAAARLDDNDDDPYTFIHPTKLCSLPAVYMDHFEKPCYRCTCLAYSNLEINTLSLFLNWANDYSFLIIVWAITDCRKTFTTMSFFWLLWYNCSHWISNILFPLPKIFSPPGVYMEHFQKQEKKNFDFLIIFTRNGAIFTVVEISLYWSPIIDWLAFLCFYGISTIVGYIMPNSIHIYIHQIYIIYKHILAITLLNEPEVIFLLWQLKGWFLLCFANNSIKHQS